MTQLKKSAKKDKGKGEDRPTGSSSNVLATKPYTETPAASGNHVIALRGLEEQLGSFLAAMSKQTELVASTIGRMTQMMEHMSQPFECYDEEMEGLEEEDDTEPSADAPPDQNTPQFVADCTIDSQVGALVGDIQLRDADREANEHLHMMNELPLEYESDDSGPAVHEPVAKLTSDMLHMNLSEEKVKTKAEEHRRPQNIELLMVLNVNTEILNHKGVTAAVKSQDLKFKNILKTS